MNWSAPRRTSKAYSNQIWTVLVKAKVCSGISNCSLYFSLPWWHNQCQRQGHTQRRDWHIADVLPLACFSFILFDTAGYTNIRQSAGPLSCITQKQMHWQFQKPIIRGPFQAAEQGFNDKTGKVTHTQAVLFPEMMHHLGQVATTVEGQVLPQHKTLLSEKLFMAPLRCHYGACKADIFCNLSDTPQKVQQVVSRSSTEQGSTDNWQPKDVLMMPAAGAEIWVTSTWKISISSPFQMWCSWTCDASDQWQAKTDALPWNGHKMDKKNSAPGVQGLLQWLTVKNLTANGNQNHGTNRPTNQVSKQIKTKQLNLHYIPQACII